MKNKTTIISTIVCLLPIVLAIIIYDKLPQQVAIHFDIAENPDNYFPKAIAAFGLPLFLAAINLYSHFRITKDPKVENASASLRGLTMWLLQILSVVLVPVTLFMAMGKQIPITMITMAIVGTVIIICGNYLPKCKRNYTIGIKLPWTLNSESNWNQTNRFSGFVWVIGGLIIIANAFIQIPYLIIAVVACLIVLPFVYSYVYYCKYSKINGGE